MRIRELQQNYASHPQIKKAVTWIKNVRSGGHLVLSGLCASARALVVSGVQQSLRRSVLFVADDEESAACMAHDLQTLLPNQITSLFPSAFRRKLRQRQADEANELARTEVLNKLMSIHEAQIVVTSPEALMECVVSSDHLKDKTVAITVGDSISMDDLEQQLISADFNRVDFVYEPGQFAVRGGIVDVFSYSADNPYRLDFFGDEVDSIRIFDIESQLSVGKVEHMEIVPDFEKQKDLLTASLLNYMPADAIVCFLDFGYVCGKTNQLAQSENRPSINVLTGDELAASIQGRTTIEFSSKSAFSDSTKVEFHTLPQPVFNKNFDLLADTLHQYINQGYRIYICSDSKKQTDRLQAIFEDKGEKISFDAVDSTLHEGFTDEDVRICCLTDHQIFERYHKVDTQADTVRRGKVVMTLKELNQLKVGDYIVHIDHGVGRFGGLAHTNVNGQMQEMVKLIYKDNDVIFVSIHSLHRISKYKGKEGEEPRINKLGSGAWDRLKERTKSKVKDIARDLIRLYAKRKSEQGFSFSADTYLQHELEASFMYEDTPDQAKATMAVKQDMERPMPMDRLICGDVGFGKTEVAMRAAFKAVCDSKQVAVLVPTTVLALQHYKSFTERFSGMPVVVEYLSRARTAKDTKEILQRLEQGKIDVLIGTQKLVGKSIRFKDLGLLIIDEEQRFGVAVKERLRQMRTNVDTLTLTATPIPRTLQFSLLGARDLSVISTPPPNRHPVQTELITPDDEDIIKEAIEAEIARNGQVFVINNRIQSLQRVENRIRRLVPDARIAVGHGQMPPEQLEQVLTDFINYDYDVLISTSIIESGVDIPNVNTIIINEANRFGLSDLHQLRGRVGRGNRRASCYLVAASGELLTRDARRRLQAIEMLSDLGSGFNIAMQDLDIRGAGNMLGAEQSGFIADLGYETYQKILNEAVTELKDEEFQNLYSKEDKLSDSYVTDCQMESDLDVGFPEQYIENTSERIKLYRELDGITTLDELHAFETRLVDRFGPVPQAGKDLMLALQLRWSAMHLGAEKLAIKGGRMTLYLVQNPKSRYYQSEEFGRLLAYMAENPRRCRLREQQGRRSAQFFEISSIAEAERLLQAI
ncbi:MAG: transcription-repair coupling factor [Paludibacteraceae bacterium]|nr:transcription-repair coupling factor [Paludibacteraceae bacterium]